MKKTRRTEEQTEFALRQAETSAPVGGDPKDEHFHPDLSSPGGLLPEAVRSGLDLANGHKLRLHVLRDSNPIRTRKQFESAHFIGATSPRISNFACTLS